MASELAAMKVGNREAMKQGSADWMPLIPPSHSVIMSGWLLKAGGQNGKKGRTRRWFVLGSMRLA